MGVLSKLVDTNAQAQYPDEGDVFDGEFGATSPALKPSAATMDAMQHGIVSKSVAQDSARTSLTDDASVAASVADVEIALVAGVSPDVTAEDATGNQPAAVKEEESSAAPQSPEVRALIELLHRHVWSDIQSEDLDIRGRAIAQQFFMRRLIVAGCANGKQEELAHAWSLHAERGAPTFEAMLQRRRVMPDLSPPLPSVVVAPKPAPRPVGRDLAVVPPMEFEPKPSAAFPERPAYPSSPSSAAPKPLEPAMTAQTGSGGFGLTDLVRAPFVLIGGAGSLVLAGLGFTGQVAKGVYVRSRTNGHSVLATQIDSSAETVVALSARLKRQGMGDVIDAIKRTGAPPEEVFAGMAEGGKYDALGKRFDRLMKQPGIAMTYSELQQEINRFDHLSKRYAKTGLELNLDHDTPIRRGSDAMMAAAEGIPLKEGGVFRQLQDRLQEMTSRIADMIRRLFSRFSPA